MNHKAILQNQQMSAQAQARTHEQQLAAKDEEIAALKERIAVLEGHDGATQDETREIVETEGGALDA